MLFPRYLAICLIAVISATPGLCDQRSPATVRRKNAETATAQSPALSDLSRIITAIDSRGGAYDRDALGRALAEAAVRAIDPGGHIEWGVGSEAAAEQPSDTVASNREETLPSMETFSNGLYRVRFRDLVAGSGAGAAGMIAGVVSTSSCKGVILDLRGAQGIGLDCVDQVAGLFLKEGAELYAFRDGNGVEVEVHRAVGHKRVERQAVVLTDAGTAGAAELLAALLKGANGIVLIGRHTAGDVRFRDRIRLSDGTVLCMALRQAVIRNGTEWNPDGVAPDVETSHAEPEKSDGVESPPAAAPKGNTAADRALEGDTTLQRAIDLLVGLEALEHHAAKN